MNSKDVFLAGEKGGGGSFRNTPDNLRSTDTFEMLLGLGTSRMVLKDGGLKNMFVDGVPVEDAQGNSSFTDLFTELFDGDPAILEPIKLRLGQSGGQNNVGLTISNAYTNGAPGDWKVATITQTNCDFIDLRFVVQQLYQQSKSGVFDATATLEIELRPSGTTTWINPLLDVTAPQFSATGFKAGMAKIVYLQTKKITAGASVTWANALPGKLPLTGKTTSAYVKELRIAVPNEGVYANKTWQVRVRLLERDYAVSGENGENEERRTIQWESIAGVSSASLGGTEAWRGLSYALIYGKATDQISGLPEITGIYDIGRYLVPPSTVWDPKTRLYTGSAWDGTTTVLAWTQDPAWQIKGLIEDDLSGISALSGGSSLNKWDVLEASKWFSQQVPNGVGGTHPRYSANWYLEQPQQVHELVNYLAGAVGAFCWDEGNGQWRMRVEKPENPALVFTKENIVGEFVYSHTDFDSRFNDITGVFRNAEQNYIEDRVRVYDQADIEQTGRRHTTVALVGCDNRQEALRRTYLRLLTSLNETRMVSFVTNRQGLMLEPLSVVAVADGDLLGDTSMRSTGRITGRRTNLLAYPDNFAAWGGAGPNAIVNSNTAAAPDGTLTADTLTDTSNTSGTGKFLDTAIPADNATYTASVYIKKTVSEPTSVVVRTDLLGSAGSVSVTCRLNPNTGVISPANTMTVTDEGNFWRVSSTRTNNGTYTSFRIMVRPSSGFNVGVNPGSDDVTATGSITVASAMLERGSTTGTYIPSGVEEITVRDTLRLELGISYQVRLTVPNPNYNPTPTTQPAPGVDWRNPTITITRNVINTASQRGDVTKLYLDSPLPSDIPEFSVISLSATNLPSLPKQYRVVSIVPQEGELVSISATEIYTSKWVESDNVTESGLASQNADKAVPAPIAPPSGVYSIYSFDGSYGSRSVLAANWVRPGNYPVARYRIETSYNGGPWQDQGYTTDTFFEIPDPARGKYQIRIYATSRSGGESPPLSASYDQNEDVLVVPSVYLTNEAITVAADGAGNVGSWAAATGSMVLQTAVGPVPGVVTYSVASTTGGLSVSINASGAYAVTGLTSNNGQATLRATWNGLNFDKVLSVAKAITGGVGPSGLNSAPVFLYQRTTANVAPALPNATLTYTFATGALSGVTNGWASTVPATGGSFLWVTTATASSSAATDTITTTEWAAARLLAQDGATGASGLNNAIVYLYQRAASPPSQPSTAVTYTFASGAVSGLSNGWLATIPSGTNPLYVIAATASGAGATDIIAANEWSTAVVLAQNGAPGAPGAPGAAGTPAISGFLTNEAVSLFAFSNGTVTSYTPATGSFRVFSGTTDVSSNFTLTTQANPQALTVTYSGQTYTVTGGFAAGADTASLTIRATGSGAFAGVVLDRVFSLSKSKGGYEIVSALPTTNLFEGRVVFLTTDDKLYRYTSGAGWTKNVDTGDLNGQVQYQQIGNGAVRLQHLLVTSSNLLPDPNFKDPAAWVQNDESGSVGDGALGATPVGWYVEEGAAALGVNEAAVGNRFITLSSSRAGQNNANNRFMLYANEVNNNRSSVSPGTVYEFKAGCHNSSNQNMYASLEYYNASGGFISSSFMSWAPGEAQIKSIQVTPPASTAWGRLLINNQGNNTLSGWTRFGNFSLKEANGATAIIDGSLVASKIASNAVTTDKLDAGAVTAAKVATSNLITLSAQIGDGLITSAKIGDAQITNAKIENLSVDTIKIAGNSVTSASSAFTLAQVLCPQATLTPIQSLTVSTIGSPVFIFFNGQFNNTSNYTDVELYRNGSLVSSLVCSNILQTFTVALTDTPPAGSHTYEIRCTHNGTGSRGVSNRSLFILETKR